MARIKKDQPRGKCASEIDDFMKELIGGCEMSTILMDMLGEAIDRQTPFSTSLNGEYENMLLDLYGYDVVEIMVRESDGEISLFEGAIKKGEKVPEEPIDQTEYYKYLKKTIIGEENQKFMLRFVSWVLKKMKEDENDSTGNSRKA